ncbi:hypothetical protein EDD21DRAFT_2722 [Dissophora ornata]|nr:hypothetical protein EDD21DRAFT_2722 [Dissophora ornata]
MHRHQRHDVASAPLTWPRKNEWHAGVLDFGLLGGASFDPDKQSWSFARNMEEFVYCRASPLTQMLPRVRPWEPRLIEPWTQDFPHVLKKGFETAINSSINNSIQYLEAVFTEDGLTNDVPLLYSIISESGYQDYSLSYYDPFMGNVCATGQFIGLPIVATPGGPTGADLAISLVSSRAHQQPPFGLLAPRSALVSFLSPICQIATPPSARSQSKEDDGRILVRTRETVTIIAPATKIPPVVSRVEHDYVSVVAEIPTTPSSCTDVTIHAAISPYVPNTYALIGDKGRIALWTHSPPAPSTAEEDSDSGDDTHQDGVRAINGMASHEQSATAQSTRPVHAPLVSLGMSKFSIIRKEGNAVSDPWRSCAWGAHPCQLVVASRSSVDLIDYRGATSQTCLFTPKTGETIRAIQEDHKLKLAPFQTYIATSLQIACIDQRFAKRPVISWAHQMDRAMPCGIKAMDLISERENYTTVLTWNRRDADVVAYNVSLGSNEHGPEPISLMGQGQDLPSFHSHTQYTNSNSLRDPQKRWQYRGGPNHIMQQGVKPPLSGLAVLPYFDINSNSEDEDEDEDEDEVDNPRKWPSVSKFSLLQYASTGAVYAQEIELRTQMEVNAAGSEVPKDSILSADYNKGSVPDTNAGSTLSSKIAHDLIVNEGLEEDEVINRLFEAAEDNVVPWKHGVAEAQERAHETPLGIRDVRSHLDLNVQKLLNKLQKYMLVDREARTKKVALNIDEKVEEAMKAIDNTVSSISMCDILNTIHCSGLSTRERSAIAQLVQQNLELDPFVTTDGGEIIHRTVKRIWLVTDRKVDALILDKEPTEEAIVAFLEHQYPLPESTVLEPNQIHQNESSITSRLASLSIPTSQAPVEMMYHAVDDEPQQQEEVWPTQESRLIRSRAIRRLAQELLLTSTVVIKTVEPDIPAAQTANEESVESLTFQYLFQNRGNGSGRGKADLRPPKILPRRCRPILGEWKIGEDPANYVYRRPNNLTGDTTGYSGDGDSDGGDGETDQEEIQERNERLMQLRRKREERENKIKTIRKRDTGYNTSAGGSASQPTGIVTDIQDFYSSMGEADEEGMFSLPTVISASQPASALRTGFGLSLNRSQQQQQAKPKPTVGFKKTTAPASLPSLRATSAHDGESRSGKQSSALSQDQSMFSSATFINSQEWETNLPAENPMKAVSMSQQSAIFKPTQSQSQSLSMSQDTDMMWGASQPVRGAFANRKIVGSSGAANKPKKKKNRTQGF